MRRRSREVVGRSRVVSFRFYFLFFIHNSCLLLFLREATRAHGEAGHNRSGRGRAPPWGGWEHPVRDGRGRTSRLRRGGDRNFLNGIEAGNHRVVIGELLVLLVSFLRCRAHN